MRYIVLSIVIFIFFGQSACSRKQTNQAEAEAEAKVAARAAQTIEGDRSAALVYMEKGREFYRDDEDAQALEAFQQALRLDPELAEAHFRLGLTYDAFGQAPEAEAAYKKAVEAYKKYLGINGNNDDAEAHYNLGQTYAGLHLYTEAVREYRQATLLKPDDAAIHYDLGLALMRLAQYDEASRAFAKSLELDPENYRAEDELAEAREGVKRIRTGKKHQEALLKKKKDGELKKQEQSGDTPLSNPSNRPT
ncbi:MAG: tetratricopeptide repeat protein [Acidobacteriota bacterium]|nr:tetratricopeptide repeat protein [Acidobacteriota bacterium]